MGEMEGRLKGFHVREHSRRLDQLDMVVKVFGEAVGRGSDGGGTARVVCPNVVFLR